MVYINKNVENLNRIFDQNSREGYLRMDLNENPGGLPDEFIKKVLADVDKEFISKYPETEPFQRFLADYIGVDRDEICLTNGSAEAIRHIIEVYTSPGGKILSVTPSYAMYEVYANMYGRTCITVPYKDGFKMDVDDIISNITDDIELVIILNPNNPMGDVYSYADAERIVAAAKEHDATVLIDEAYFYFYPNSFMKLAVNNDHVLLTRTFSKLFSLAGCRLGYCIGNKNDIALVQKMCTPHNVNAFGIKFAYEIMSTDGMLEKMIEKQKEGKRYLIETLRSHGYEVNDSEGNFIFIKTKTDAGKLTRKLKEMNVLVKHYTTPPYDNFIRVTTGEKEIIDKFLHVFLQADQ